MKYTKTNTKKLYTSPELSIHELSVESVCVTGTTPGLPWDNAPRFKKIKVEVVDEEEYIDDETIEWNLSSDQFKL